MSTSSERGSIGFSVPPNNTEQVVAWARTQPEIVQGALRLSTELLERPFRNISRTIEGLKGLPLSPADQAELALIEASNNNDLTNLQASGTYQVAKNAETNAAKLRVIGT